MESQRRKATVFRELHEREELLLLPNAWGGGAARVLEHFGFEAMGTTSAGAAFSKGLLDGALGRDEILANLAEICAATSLPVTADLQDGFSADPANIGEVIERAAECGAAGCSIEDAGADPPHPIYPLSQAVERVQAAVEAAARLPFPFFVTARADNFFRKIDDIDDTLARLVRFERAGADALYAPLVSRLDHVRLIRATVGKPLNVLLYPGAGFALADLQAAGVRRVSVGGYFSKVALAAMFSPCVALKDEGRLLPPGGGTRLEELFARGNATLIRP